MKTETSSSARWSRRLAVAGLVGLLILHLDFWREQRPELVFGWLPEDVAYRLAWMGLAFVYLWFFTRNVWGEGEDA